MTTYIETLTETRNQMIAEYENLIPKREEHHDKMMDALTKWNNREAYEAYFNLYEEEDDKMHRLIDAINMVGNAIGHLDPKNQPETFWGK